MINQNDQIGRIYSRPEDMVTRPDRWVMCSQYFVRRWLPELGGTAVSLVLFLRNYGYYNPETGECRDEIRGVSETIIAKGVGCSVPTLRRLLAEHPYIGFFVRVQPDYEMTANGRRAQIANIYWIAMSDPVHPEDADLLQEAREIFAEQQKIAPPFKMIGGADQNDRGARIKMSPPPDQNERPNIRTTPKHLLNENLLIINQKSGLDNNGNANEMHDDDEFFDKKTDLSSEQAEAYKLLISAGIAAPAASRLSVQCTLTRIRTEVEIDSYREQPQDGSRGRLIAILEGRAKFPIPAAYQETRRQARQQKNNRQQQEKENEEQARKNALVEEASHF